MAADNNNSLKDFIDSVADNSHLRVERDLGDGYFRLRATEAQRRQAKQDIRCCEDVVIEMLRNSRDAGAKNIFVATNSQENFRNILIVDDGLGVPKSHHKTIFEPYVTSKLDTMITDSWGVHGRGMALYSISENAEEAFVVNSDSGKGCSIQVKCDTAKLSEKRDQSTFPDFFVNEESELVVRGPKNILRACCEFAVESRGSANVYIGSPVEIAATLYNISLGDKDLKKVFKEPDNQTRLVDLIGFSCDVHDFKNYARELGIYLSKRTARRIMDGDIKPQISVLERISEKGIQSNAKGLDKNAPVFDIFDIKKIYRAQPKKNIIKLDAEDKESLKYAVCEEFAKIAGKYYLNPKIEPEFKSKNNKVSITFELEEID